MMSDVTFEWTSTNRLIDIMIEQGMKSSRYKLTGVEFMHFDRKMVEVEITGGFRLLFYRSVGKGTGPESRGEWVPTPAIMGGAMGGGWILKRSYIGKDGHKVNPKFTKYDVPLYQRIARDLKKKYKNDKF